MNGAYTESLSSNSVNVSESVIVGTGGDSSAQAADATLIGRCIVRVSLEVRP